MLEIQGFQLDNKHILTELVDKDGEKSWWLFEFKNEIVDGVVNCDEPFPNGSLFDMKQINPNEFEWNGRKLCLRKNQLKMRREKTMTKEGLAMILNGK